ncbi:hypothetical protein HK097_003378 [Rhizophlyctis rosea]|uniref:Uncharacterized protein n=1 Tax=Rhizophlyctis rosea TaxID=64517 RepID=A0AAD5WXX6_9FUNG|nr:hypothetical protein HK097_003378 [Rhizophlyctis rosea]
MRFTKSLPTLLATASMSVNAISLSDVPTACLGQCAQFVGALDCITPLQNATTNAALQTASNDAAVCLCPQIAPSDTRKAAAVQACQTCVIGEAEKQGAGLELGLFSSALTQLIENCERNDTAAAGQLIAGVVQTAQTFMNNGTATTTVAPTSSSTAKAAGGASGAIGFAQMSSAGVIVLAMVGGVLMM